MSPSTNDDIKIITPAELIALSDQARAAMLKEIEPMMPQTVDEFVDEQLGKINPENLGRRVRHTATTEHSRDHNVKKLIPGTPEENWSERIFACYYDDETVGQELADPAMSENIKTWLTKNGFSKDFEVVFKAAENHTIWERGKFRGIYFITWRR